MKWIKKHKIFSITGGIVLALCLIIAVSYATAGGTSFIGKGINKVVVSIQKPLASFSGGVKGVASGIWNFRETERENERLKKENEKLQEENMDIKLTKQELEDLRAFEKMFSYDALKGKKRVVGKVIQIDLSNPYVVFTIDIGKEKNIKEGDVVVDSKGLVGKIISVGNGWSKVVSILSDNNNISFRNLRDKSITGVLKGNGKDKLEGYVMNEKDKIISGDTLVTSGMGVYPMGIKIGKVSSIEYDDDQQLKTVTIKPTVDFKNLQKVAVLL